MKISQAAVFAALIGGLCLTTSSQAQPMSRAEVKMHNGRPMVFIDGVPNPLPAYSPVAVAARFGEKPFTQAARFYPHRMGAYFITIPSIKMTDWSQYFDTQFWVDDAISSTPLAEADGSIERQVREIIKGDPGARIIIRFFAHEPKSWRDLHPEQCFVNEEGKRWDVPSMASEEFRTSVAEYCRAVVAYCEAQPWAKRIIGYANLERVEGTFEPIIHGWLFDHSPLMTARWRQYLREKYGTVEALRAAHNDPDVNFETTKVPRDKLRRTAPEVASLLYWQNAKDNQPLRDYLLLNRDLYHRNLRSLAAAMKGGVEKTGRKRFVVFDSLKLSMLGWNNTGFFDSTVPWPLAYPEDRAGSGHLSVSELFNAPGLDGLLTPHDYQARGAGGVYEPEGSVDSAVLRGKIFFCEMDTRTYADKDIIAPARNDREFAALTWRNLASSWTRGFQSYWMDLHQDWYASEAMHKTIARQVQTIKASVHWKHETMPGIAVILDDEAILETNGNGNVFNEQIMWEQKMGLARCGVPFRIYLLDDLKLPNFPKHRVYYFPNLYRVDGERLKLLREKVMRDGNVVVWGPGSGISDGTKVGAESATRLTGFQFNFLNVNDPRRTLICDFAHPITRGLKADTILGGPLAYGPVLYPKDGRELGRAWAKGGNDWMGLAVKSFGRGARSEWKQKGWHKSQDWASVFTTTAPLPADLWRNIARFAGAHVYNEGNDVLMADSSVVALHSLQSGEKQIALPGEFTVYDVITGKLVGKRLKLIKFQLNGPETRVFRLVGQP